MNIEEYRNYCLAKKEVTEGTPFGPDVLVFKVSGKMFALSGIENFATINLKCDPEKALQQRAEFNAVKPGYHMSKKHWNTITVNEDVPDQLLYEMIDESYELVVKSLPKKIRLQLEN